MQANPLLPNSSGLPSVAASLPQDGDQNVALDVSIAVRFSKPLQVDTVNLNTAVLADPEASNVVVKVVAAEAGMLAFVTPQTSLLPGTGYTLTLSGVTDPSGLALPDTTITFTTAGGNSSI